MDISYPQDVSRPDGVRRARSSSALGDNASALGGASTLSPPLERSRCDDGPVPDAGGEQGGVIAAAAIGVGEGPAADAERGGGLASGEAGRECPDVGETRRELETVGESGRERRGTSLRGITRQISRIELTPHHVREVPAGFWSLIFVLCVWLPSFTAIFWKVEGWPAWRSFIFTGTLCATIGYGNIVPSTDQGKILVVLCGVVGIPCVMQSIFFLGQILLYLIHHVLCRCLHRTPRSFERNGVLLLISVISYSHCVLVYMFTEDWSFVDAFYYTFTCFSTIGFGDFVPLDQPEDMSPITFIHFWHVVMVTLGLSLLAAAFSLARVGVEETDRKLSKTASNISERISSSTPLSKK